jgi:hypothetical protein
MQSEQEVAYALISVAIVGAGKQQHLSEAKG